MKPHIFQVTDEDVGKLGIKKHDVGRWVVLVQGAIHFRESFAAAKEMYDYITR